MAEPLEQLNLRVSREAADLFQAAVFVRDLKSVQELLRPVLEAHADALRTDDSVTAAVALREQNRAGERQNVRELPARSSSRAHSSE
jgi:hypothetical protein